MVFFVCHHIHGRYDLLRLSHMTTIDCLKAISFDKIVLVPDYKSHDDIRLVLEEKQLAQNAPLSAPNTFPDQGNHIAISSELKSL